MVVNNMPYEKMWTAWQKASTATGLEQMKQFFAIWDKTLKSYGVDQKCNFVENWENVMEASGVEQFKAFSELMKQYSGSWQNLGKK
ncbi:MAG: hypothetical protein ACRD90_02650 [Nitrosopumilaceae archaeon]